MTEAHENQEQPEPQATGPTPGQLLREARLKRNLAPRDIAERLRLRLAIIELIEDDDYDSFSSGTFVRGYLRAYAKTLELNESDIIAAYERVGYTEPTKINLQSFSRRKKREANDRSLMYVSYAILVVVISMAVVWWVQEPDSDLGTDTSSRAAIERSEQVLVDEELSAPGDGRLTEEQVNANDVSTALSANDPSTELSVAGDEVATPVVTTEPERVESGTATADSDADVEAPVVTSPPPTTSTASETDPATDDSADTAEPEQRVMRDPANATPPAAELASADLVLTFTGDCWVKVEDASGETIAIGVKPQGYQMPLSGEAPYSITLGAPELVDIRFRGEAVDMSQYRQGRVARFTLE